MQDEHISFPEFDLVSPNVRRVCVCLYIYDLLAHVSDDFAWTVFFIQDKHSSTAAISLDLLCKIKCNVVVNRFIGSCACILFCYIFNLVFRFDLGKKFG